MRMHSSEISKIIENFINTDKSLWEDLYGVNKKFIQILFNNHPEISFLKSYEETQRICEFDNPFKEDIIWSNNIHLPKVKNSNTFVFRKRKKNTTRVGNFFKLLFKKRQKIPYIM